MPSIQTFELSTYRKFDIRLLAWREQAARDAGDLGIAASASPAYAVGSGSVDGS
jgi:hypothetical protein